MNEYLRESFNGLQEILKEAGTIIMSGVGQPADSFKEDSTPFSKTDKKTEDFIVGRMREQFPDIPVLGEEGGYDPDALPETLWLIDPIDGTESYIKNIPAFTSMATLIKDGVTIASMIYNPSTGNIYAAIKGEGAQKNGQKIDLRALPMPNVVACKPKIIEPLTALLKTAGLNTEASPSGAGYGFARVVDGEIAARFHMYSGPHIHDHAPGALLVQEAGGEIIPIFRREFDLTTRSFVACHPNLKEFVLDNIEKLREFEDPGQINY